MNSVKILAKEVVATRKAVERMHCAKAQLSSVSMSLSASVCKYHIYCYFVFCFSF
jgi:hypothetical protein